MSRFALSILITFAASCTLNSQQKDKCVTSADCNSGNSCIASICRAISTLTNNAGGQCSESFPPALCQQPAVTYVAPDPAALARSLPGRWLYCNSDGTFGQYKFGPPEAVGIEFADDGSWNFVFADSNGVAYLPQGPTFGGPTRDVHLTSVNGDTSQVAVDLQLTDGSTYRLWTQIADNPQRLRMANLYGGINYYVWSPAPAGCSQPPPDMGGTCGAAHDMTTIAHDMTTLPDQTLPTH
jgi:hypothetical protein